MEAMQNSERIRSARYALYIKLGSSGSWEKECIEKGILRFGYKESPFEAAISGDWETVREVWNKIRPDAGAATRDVEQIKHFFADAESTLWITFSNGLLWWCFARSGVHKDETGTYRKCVDGWHSTDTNGKQLSMDKLSGSLLRVQGFRGTICDVKDFDYLKRKLNGEVLPEVVDAIHAKNQMIEKITPLMCRLTWQDFELLVDLVFSNSGWRRVSQVGKTQKTVDIELFLPTTGERAFVQVKSEASKSELAEYLDRLDHSAWSRMFFVWHTGKLSDEVFEGGNPKVTLIGPKKLSLMVFDAGLTTWLMDKVS